MKILQVLVLVFWLGGFCSIVKAQADCLFSFRLGVLDNKGIILRNAQVKFRGRDLSYNSDLKAFYFSTLTGCNSKIKGLLEVTARGFEDFEREIEVRGSFSSYELKLNATESKQTAIFEELAVVSGIVKDANEAVIPNTRVILTDESGKITETVTNENGYFRLDVQGGKYALEFIGTAGFKVKKYENFDLTKGYKNLDVVLEVKPCPEIDCHWIEGTPVKENNKP
jgi:hypothetical protein